MTSAKPSAYLEEPPDDVTPLLLQPRAAHQPGVVQIEPLLIPGRQTPLLRGLCSEVFPEPLCGRPFDFGDASAIAYSRNAALEEVHLIAGERARLVGEDRVNLQREALVIRR